MTQPAQPTELPGELVFLSFSEGHSCRERVEGYEFRAEGGACTVFFHLADEEEPYLVPVDETWAAALTDIVRRNNIILWDGFSGSDSRLLDGDSFRISLKFSDGTTAAAGGYGRFPEGYGQAAREIGAHFLQLLPEDVRQWPSASFTTRYKI